MFKFEFRLFHNLKHILFYLLIFFSFSLKAQKETNIWYFGDKAGLDFNTTPPTVLTNSAMSTIATAGSISDANGDILFYTNGNTVWNKNHQVMSNGTGLNGNLNYFTSGLIIPKPGSNRFYYIITQTTTGLTTQIPGDLYYSVVDIQQNSGLGAVLNPKNVLISSNIDGSVAAGRHSSCGNFWLVCRQWKTNKLKSYLVSASGISSNPVVSNVGSTSYRLAINSLRLSPNSDFIASVLYTDSIYSIPDTGHYEIYNFDNSTGQATFFVQLPPKICGPFAVEFSPNEDLIYCTSGNWYDEKLLQYDISLATTAAIQNSRVVLDSQFFDGQLDLQLAPDGKIYVIPGGVSSSIGYINYPNKQDSACDYVKYGINLLRFPKVSFPRMIPSQPNGISVRDTCENDSTSLELLNPGQYISYAWNFGDPASGASNSSTLPNPKHLFSGPGTYPIMFLGLNSCFVLDTILDTLHIRALPSFELGNDSLICQGDTVILNAWDSSASYIWSDSTVDSIYRAVLDTTYWVEVTNGCGSVYDTISIGYRNFDDTDLGNDTSLCPGDSLLLDATTKYASHYLWQNNSTDSTLLATMQGTYSVEVGNGCDTLHDSIDVFYITPPAIDLGPDTLRCFPDSILLSGKLPGVDYLWYNGDTTQFLLTSDTGFLWLEASNLRCSARDSIYIDIYDSLRVYLGEDSLMCVGQTLLLDATQNVGHAVNYLWQNSAITSSISVSSSGVYVVQVSDYCMSISDTIELIFNDVPQVFLGNDTTICFGDDLQLDAGTDGSIYLWYDNTNTQYNTVNGLGKYWVQVENICGQTSDTISVSIRHAPNVYLGADSTLCIDHTMLLDAYADDATYLWQDGSTGRYYLVKNEGEFWVDVENSCDTDQDTILAYYIDKPTVNLGDDLESCEGEILVLDASNDQSVYKWSTGSKDSSIYVSSTGEYYVEVVNQCGIATDQLLVVFKDCNCNLHIPNAFTPNGDNKNEMFFIEYSCDLIEFEIGIFNRWGEEIFTSKKAEFEWDGTYNGKDIPSGVYVYDINYKFNIGNSVRSEGRRGSLFILK